MYVKRVGPALKRVPVQSAGVSAQPSVSQDGTWDSWNLSVPPLRVHAWKKAGPWRLSNVVLSSCRSPSLLVVKAGWWWCCVGTQHPWQKAFEGRFQIVFLKTSRRFGFSFRGVSLSHALFSRDGRIPTHSCPGMAGFFFGRLRPLRRPPWTTPSRIYLSLSSIVFFFGVAHWRLPLRVCVLPIYERFHWEIVLQLPIYERSVLLVSSVFSGLGVSKFESVNTRH